MELKHGETFTTSTTYTTNDPVASPLQADPIYRGSTSRAAAGRGDRTSSRSGRASGWIPEADPYGEGLASTIERCCSTGQGATP